MASYCKFCRIYGNDEDEDNGDQHMHRQSLKHRFNALLYFYNHHRHRFLSDGANDIELKMSLTHDADIITLNAGDTKLILKTTLNSLQRCRSIDVDFKIKNIANCFVTLTDINFLHPIEIFHYHDITGAIVTGNYAELEPGALYHFRLRFFLHQPVIGEFMNIISLTLQKHNQKKVFYINRECYVEISDESQVTEMNALSPFTSKDWVANTLVPSIKNRSDLHLKYRVPAIYETLITAAKSGINLAPYHPQCMEIRYRLQQLQINNYVEYFHTLLYLDEVVEMINLKQYNMENIPIKVVSECIFELGVPGLAEKRPSLIPGDIIILRLHDSNTAYEGIITKIKDEVVWLQHLDENFMMSFEQDSEFMADVKFKLNRLNYVRKHEAVDNSIDMMQVLFPNAMIHVGNQHRISNRDFFNNSIASNPEQHDSVTKILNGSNCRAPYIVFGPPGTGKTVTIVESILQIKKRIPNAKILICAPSNAACDNIALKLSKYINLNTKEMIRIQAENIDWRLIPNELLPYCNCDNNVFVPIKNTQINNYKIVITTLVLCGKYRGRYTPDYVFIDEAAQASEPECLIPITMMKRNGKAILCGDPKQLGPITYCKVNTLKRLLSEPNYLEVTGERFGLGISLLERLEESGIYDVCTCYTMLIQNFRSHKSLLTIPNRLFYQNSLVAMSYEAQNDSIAGIPFYLHAFPNNQTRRRQQQQQTGLHAMEFCAIFGQERKEGTSPSYFNPKEIEAVMKYVKALLNNNVKETDIGIIAPYIRQVYKIRGRLNNMGHTQIEIGSTEAFQGREKRVIIISTVRAKDNLLLYDKKYKLGFVEDPRRFNVAITRPKSKLIMIGNPNILQYSPQFKMLIKECINMGSYYGPMFAERNDALMHDIMRRMKGMDEN